MNVPVPEFSKALNVPESSKVVNVPESSKTVHLPESSRAVNVRESSRAVNVHKSSKAVPVLESSCAMNLLVRCPSQLPHLKDSDDSMWINLFMTDRAILRSKQWLNDGILQEAQSLLRELTEGKVVGWQSTQCCKKYALFKPIPSQTPYVQVLHLNGNHWLLVSNIDPRMEKWGCKNNSVEVYDSLRPTNVSNILKGNGVLLCQTSD